MFANDFNNFTEGENEAWGRIPGIDAAALLEEYNNPPEVLPSGIPALDTHLAGGMVPGVYVVAGMPGGGKSALALQLAADTAATGRRVLVVTAEMTVGQCVARVCSHFSKTGASGVKTFKWSDWEHMGKARDPRGAEAVRHLVEEVPGLKIVDPSGMESLDELAPMLEDAAKAGVSLVVVDYLQRMPAPSEASDADEYKRVGAVADFFMDAAKELGLRILVLTSTGRAARAGSKALDSTTAGLGSSSIEYNATATIGLTPGERADNGGRVVRLSVDKARRGIPTGKKHPIELVFDGAYNTFTQLMSKVYDWDDTIYLNDEEE